MVSKIYPSADEAVADIRDGASIALLIAFPQISLFLPYIVK